MGDSAGRPDGAGQPAEDADPPPGDGETPPEPGDDADPDEQAHDHLAGVSDGDGCTEIWERLSEHRRADEE